MGWFKSLSKNSNCLYAKGNRTSRNKAVKEHPSRGNGQIECASFYHNPLLYFKVEQPLTKNREQCVLVLAQRRMELGLTETGEIRFVTWDYP